METVQSILSLNLMKVTMEMVQSMSNQLMDMMQMVQLKSMFYMMMMVTMVMDQSRLKKIPMNIQVQFQLKSQITMVHQMLIMVNLLQIILMEAAIQVLFQLPKMSNLFQLEKLLSFKKIKSSRRIMPRNHNSLDFEQYEITDNFFMN